MDNVLKTSIAVLNTRYLKFYKLNVYETKQKYVNFIDDYF